MADILNYTLLEGEMLSNMADIRNYTVSEGERLSKILVDILNYIGEGLGLCINNHNVPEKDG